MWTPYVAMSSRPLTTAGLGARRIDDATCVIAPEGVLDLESSPPLRHALAQLVDQGCVGIVVDLSRVTFMDSTALAVLVGAKRRLGASGELAVAGADRQAVKLFELTGIERTIKRFPTVDAAVASLAERRKRPAASGAATSRPLPLTRDAAVVLGIAATAMAFTDSADEQVERWLHALLRHGQAGVALASFGFTEDLTHAALAAGASRRTRPDDRYVVSSVITRAQRIASDAGASKTGTSHLLLAVIERYRGHCDDVLASHGVDRDRLRALLQAEPPELGG